MARRKQTQVTEETGTSNLPVPWEEKMKAQAAQAAKMEAGGGNFISVRGGVLSWMGEPMPNNELRCVIFGGVGEHTYYDTPFDSEVIVPPTCFSVFELLGEQPHPHEDVPEDQRQDEGKGCKQCWAHAFKSADNGRGRACSVRRRLLLMPEAGLEDEDQMDTAIMKVPPTSVQTWSKYVQTLAAQHQRPPFMVVTRVWVTPHPKFQFEVKFEAVEMIEGELYEELNQMAENGRSILLQPFDMSAPEEEETPRRLKTDRAPARTAKKKVVKKTSRRR